MTASRAFDSVFFDTWAWWEIFLDSARGRRLARRYLTDPPGRVHVSVLSLAEISAKLAEAGLEDRIARQLDHVETHARVHPVSRAVAEAAGPLRAQLRTRHPRASLIDAAILATARGLGHSLISADTALVGEKDVRDH